MDSHAAELAAIRERALAATRVSVVITNHAEDGPAIVWVNPAFEHTTGYRASEVLGQSPRILQGQDTDPQTAKDLSTAVQLGKSTSVTLLNYRSNGTPFWNQVTVTPLRNDAGAITHWVGIQLDVTDQKREQDRQMRTLDVERRSREALALVSDAAEILTDIDSPTVLADVADLLSTGPVAWAGFYTADDTLRHAEGLRRSPYQDLRDGVRLQSYDPGSDPVHALVTGLESTALTLNIANPNLAEQGLATQWLVRDLRARAHEWLDSKLALVLPVIGRTRTLGVMVAIPTLESLKADPITGLPQPLQREQVFDQSTLTLLHITARRVGAAVDNARLYQREHQLAETLQRAMLPQQQAVDGLDVWTYYAPSSDHAQVGGDWYDVVEINPDVISIVIGDVVGHDVEAAAAMGQLRSVVRAYAFELKDAGAVVERVDSLVSGMGLSRPASLVYLAVDRSTDPWQLNYSSAGHLPGLVVRDGEVIQLGDARGQLIGFHGGERKTATRDLYPGDVLVLYTDGLIERRDRHLKDGFDALLEVLGEPLPADSSAIGEHLLAALATDPQDDVAVVVVRIPHAADDEAAIHDDGPRSRRWQLAPEPAAIAMARQSVTRTAEGWGWTDLAAAELVTSELVANAVLHGWGHIRLRVFAEDDTLTIEVEDANPAPPQITDGHTGRVGGYGVQIVARLAEWGWRPSGEGKVVWAVLSAGADQGIARS